MLQQLWALNTEPSPPFQPLLRLFTFREYWFSDPCLFRLNEFSDEGFERLEQHSESFWFSRTLFRVTLTLFSDWGFSHLSRTGLFSETMVQGLGFNLGLGPECSQSLGFRITPAQGLLQFRDLNNIQSHNLLWLVFSDRWICYTVLSKEHKFSAHPQWLGSWV